MFSFPSLTLIGSVRPSTSSLILYSLSRILPLFRPTTPLSSTSTSSMRTSLTPPYPNLTLTPLFRPQSLTLTLTLTLTPRFRPHSRREQRVSPSLPSLRSAQALSLTLTPLSRPPYHREQRVYPPLPSLQSARALPPTPSHRPAPHPSRDELGPLTCPPRRRSTPRLWHLPRPPLSPPSMYVGGGTRGLRGDVLS